MDNRIQFYEYNVMVSHVKSGKPSSYATAIRIMDEIFRQVDVFGLKGQSLCDIEDIKLLTTIRDYIKSEEKKKRQGVSSIFDLGRPNQTSYSCKGFCSASILSLIDFVRYKLDVAKADEIVGRQSKANKISSLLIEHFDLTKEGKDEVAEIKRRKGQSYFRRMVLANYANQCCITGLNVPELLRASHIVAWKDDKPNRMNPENGLCLSATYDAAFDQHLISFDEDYRLIVSKSLREYYTSQTTRDYFDAFEGKKLILPKRYLPNQKLLAKHRDIMVI
ncbi:MAG: HNH endonuclease [Muribaculaceae bacterium]|nr:HNH endonuclease [Muribaculaceae bacterium]